MEVATGKQPKICFLSFGKNAIMPFSQIFLDRIEVTGNKWGQSKINGVRVK